MKLDLKSMTMEELTAFIENLGEPSYRAVQILRWIHSGVNSFREMTNLSGQLIRKLEEISRVSHLEIFKRYRSKLDETVKYLFRVENDEIIETVVMRYQHGFSICLSSQIGCRMGCAFCQSTKMGLVRSLTAGEILDQILIVQKDLNVRISNIVLMGIGEPLDNYDSVLRFLKIVNDPNGINIGYRHISLSTCGIVPNILRLAEENLPITLSISLHAATDEKRIKMMPINKKYRIEKLIGACRKYQSVTGRRISFEYAVIAGINDSAKDAKDLADLLKGMLCHVNLIPVNPIDHQPFLPPREDSIKLFQRTLIRYGLNTTVRRTLGRDISASCGQLRHQILKKEGCT